MAENNEMQKEYSIFADTWKLFKKYYDVPKDTIDWNKVIAESCGIEKMYNCQLCNDLLVAVITELERKHIE